MSSTLGTRGEDLAVNYLKNKGYTIIEQNWHCQRGEIDIVAQVGELWVFCEVKTRRSTSTQQAFVNITESKAKKIIASVQHYLHEHVLEDVVWRIDAIGIAIPHNGKPIIDHVEDALDW